MEAAALPQAPSRSRGRLSRRATDGDLVVRLRAGDDTAFEEIYDRHHRGLFAFCRHMLGSRHEAEDAVQHVFLAVHRNLRASDSAVVLKPWLYTVARNRCLNMLAARRDGTSIDDVAEPSTDGLAVADAVERRQDLQALLGDLAGLPDDQRAALLLAELGDLSHEEIAVALEVRREKVKALVFQARTSLMNARDAREVDCRAIQEQLSTLRGGDLRRVTLRKHVAMCPSCAAFKAEVRRQRAALALVLPVLPSAALKGSVFSAVFGSGGAGGAALAGAGAAASGGGGLLGGAGLAKTLAAIAIAGGIGGGGVVAVHELEHHGGGHVTAPAVAPAGAARPDGAAAPGGAGAASAARGHERQALSHRHRAAAHPGRHRHGTPSNGEPGSSKTSGTSTSATPSAGKGLALGKGHGTGRPAGTPVARGRAGARPLHPTHPAHPVSPGRGEHRGSTEQGAPSSTRPIPPAHGKAGTQDTAAPDPEGTTTVPAGSAPLTTG